MLAWALEFTWEGERGIELERGHSLSHRVWTLSDRQREGLLMGAVLL